RPEVTARPGPRFGTAPFLVEVADERDGTVLLRTPAHELGGAPRTGVSRGRLAPEAGAFLSLGTLDETPGRTGKKLALRGWDLRTGRRLDLPETPGAGSLRVFPNPHGAGVVVACAGTAVWHKDNSGLGPSGPSDSSASQSLEAEV